LLSEWMFTYKDKAIQSDFLQEIFTAVPPNYDLINHLITWGLDRRWRQMAAKECLASQPERILDLCCGTGDLAVTLARLAGRNTEVIGVDHSQPMLEIAAQKAKRVSDRVKLLFVFGDIANIPFPDSHFDCIATSFALRNLTYKNPLAGRYIAEVLRVLNTDGRFVILETSQPKSSLIKKLYHLYMRYFVFRLGLLISGNREGYYYLADSATNYYAPEELKKILVEAGFRQVSFRHLLLGAVSILIVGK
jgi:demethylmenaquinone methyltransferase/2-methoxy-6-polyprenyl-1,4-benzoquinol methylase